MILRNCKSLLLCLAFCFLSNVVVGQVVFDNDSTDGTWENPVNWNGDVLPSATDNVQIHSGLTASLTTNQSVTDFTVGSDGAAGTTGTVNHTAGTLAGAGTSWAKVGTDGAGNVGTYNLSGSAALANFDVFALGIVGGVGELNLSDTASLSTNSGVAMGGTATVNQTGGTFTSGAWIGISNFGGGVVDYNISAGSVISNGDVFTVGEDGAGNLNVSGTAIVQANGLSMIVGRNDNSAGILEITGSSASVSVTDLLLDTATGSSATVSFIADAGGVTSIFSADNTEFGDNALLSVDLTADAAFANYGIGALSKEILLIDNAAAVVGTFAGLAEGATINIGGGKTGTISYIGGVDGNDVVILVSVPEPASIVVIGLGALALSSRRRRR
jgi:hypothetical protein